MNKTAVPTNDEIRVRAHQLWEAAGMPVGRDDEFWEQAKAELEEEAQDDAV